MAELRWLPHQWQTVKLALETSEPFAEMILNRQKTIETRTYALPSDLIGEVIAVFEPKLQALIGIVVFGSSFQYESRQAWAADSDRHCVMPNASSDAYGWDATIPKWGWPVAQAQASKHAVAAPRMTRIHRSLFSIEWSEPGVLAILSNTFSAARTAAANCTQTAAAKAGQPQLLVLADFDRTLTAYQGPHGGVGEECHDIIFHHWENKRFQKTAAKLLEVANIEKAGDPADLGFASWDEYAVWWWDTAHKAMIDNGLRRSDLRKSCAAANCALRRGYTKLVQLLRERSVPMVIVSAGLTDVIFELMHHSLAEEVQPQYSLSDSVSRAPISVVSNKMIFRQLEKGDAIIDRFEDGLIHWLNKGDTMLSLAKDSSLLLSEKVVLLLGDSLKDVLMIDGLPIELQPKASIKIGFLNNQLGQAELDTSLDSYLEAFDVVVVGDGSLRFVTELIGKLCDEALVGDNAKLASL